MDRLLFATPSPYSCKVRMAAAFAGIPLDLVPTVTGDRPPELVDANPLVKIPVLITQADGAVFDSRSIVRYLDRKSGGKLFPADHAGRTKAEVMEALADGMCDAMLAHVYERRYHPEEKIHQPWLDKQWIKVEAAFRYAAQHVTEVPEHIHAGHIGLRVATGYRALRFDDTFEPIPAAVRQWAEAFDRRFPELTTCLPA